MRLSKRVMVLVAFFKWKLQLYFVLNLQVIYVERNDLLSRTAVLWCHTILLTLILLVIIAQTLLSRPRVTITSISASIDCSLILRLPWHQKYFIYTLDLPMTNICTATCNTLNHVYFLGRNRCFLNAILITLNIIERVTLSFLKIYLESSAFYFLDNSVGWICVFFLLIFRFVCFEIWFVQK